MPRRLVEDTTDLEERAFEDLAKRSSTDPADRPCKDPSAEIAQEVLQTQ